MTYNLSFGLFRLILGSALVLSVAWQVTDRMLNNLFRPGEYFAYFSIVTAIVAGAFLVISGILLIQNKPENKTIELTRLSMTVALIVVGVVYHLLLADAAPDSRDIGYVWPVLPNQVIHTYAPMLIALDYLLSVKGHAVKMRAALWVAVFPLIWLAFSVVRGILSGWWPYWFIDPTGDGGLAGMLTYVGLITGFFIILGYLVLGIKVGVRKIATR
jgi:hypothetical protein